MNKPEFTATPSLEWAQLAHLATHLGRVSTALLVQVVPDGPVIMGASGLPADQQAVVVAMCADVAADPALKGCLLDALAHPTWAAHPLMGSLAPHPVLSRVSPAARREAKPDVAGAARRSATQCR